MYSADVKIRYKNNFPCRKDLKTKIIKQLRGEGGEKTSFDGYNPINSRTAGWETSLVPASADVTHTFLLTKLNGRLVFVYPWHRRIVVTVWEGV